MGISENGGEGVIRELYRKISHTKNWKMSEISEKKLLKLEMLNCIKKIRLWLLYRLDLGQKEYPIKHTRFTGISTYCIFHWCGKMSKEISRVIVSTDSDQYAKIAKKFGAEVPYLRPKDISGDTATDIEFVSHAIQWFYENENVFRNF